jgi:hypothetical protein
MVPVTSVPSGLKLIDVIPEAAGALVPITGSASWCYVAECLNVGMSA